MGWQRVSLVVPGDSAEALADALSEAGALATDTEDADAGTPAESLRFAEPGAEVSPWARARVSALFFDDADVDSVLGAALAASGADCLEPPRLETVAEADWVRLTQSQFLPTPVGRRLWVVPSWHEPPQPGAINIRLDPGAAFGTGTHPTTQLVLAWLEATVRGGETVLDYGCGSGVLAIAALKLGASRAFGVDIDPLALEAARYNAIANGVALACQSPDLDAGVIADITVANILANPLRMLAPLLAARTRPGGLIALSGVLESQAGEVMAAYAPWFDMHTDGMDAGWVCLAGTRRPHP